MINKLSTTTKIYIGLIVIMVIARLMLVIVPLTLALQDQQSMLAWVNLPLVAVLGYIGLRLAPRMGFPEWWGATSTPRQRMLTPALIGIGLGVLCIALDLLQPSTSAVTKVHASFPAVIFLYVYASVYLNVILRLFLVTCLLWFIALVLLRGRWQEPIFWSLVILITVLSAAGETWAVYQVSGGHPLVTDLLFVFFSQLGAELVAFWLYRKHGFLAPVVMYFSYFVVWHILWGGVIIQVLHLR